LILATLHLHTEQIFEDLVRYNYIIALDLSFWKPPPPTPTPPAGQQGRQWILPTSPSAYTLPHIRADKVENAFQRWDYIVADVVL